jgi:SAM-dependent methyltransferase
MKKLPEAEIYEKGLEYWPYKASLDLVIKKICELAPEGSRLLDIMCGPGYLLGKIKEKRPDLILSGVDVDERYVSYGHDSYPGVYFEKGDVLNWQPKDKFDVVVCTGSVHHIPYELQEKAIANIASMAKSGGIVIISDCYVDNFSNENERKQASAKLGYEYIKETIANGGPDKVVEWTVDILWNDVLKYEFKPSFENRIPLLEKYFANIRTIKTWPDNTPPGYGDYVHICKVK